MKNWGTRNVTLFVTLLKKLFLLLFITTGLMTVTSPTMALSDTYFVTGQDLDLLMESDRTYVMEEIEYELRKIPLFRDVEDFILNVKDDYR